jgi:hypothetical protein
MSSNPKPLTGRRWFRPALAALLIVHGVIHAIAPLVLWDLIDFRDVDGEPIVTMPAVLADALGAVWILVLALFVVAGFAVFARLRWWAPLTVVAVALSQALIVLWWDGAWRGTVANALILGAVWIDARDRRRSS